MLTHDEMIAMTPDADPAPLPTPAPVETPEHPFDTPFVRFALETWINEGRWPEPGETPAPAGQETP